MDTIKTLRYEFAISTLMRYNIHMGYGYSNKSSYYKTQNLSPRVAAIYLANKASEEKRSKYELKQEHDLYSLDVERNIYNPTKYSTEQQQALGVFTSWSYDEINGQLFYKYDHIKEAHPELEPYFKTKKAWSLRTNSIVVVNLECPAGHQWKEKAKDFIYQHRKAITLKQPTCVQCHKGTIEEQLKAEAEQKALAKLYRTPRQTVQEHHERYFYIHEVNNSDGETIAYKYGITIDIYSRRNQQENALASGLSLKTVYKIKSTSKEVCIIENRIKANLAKKNIKPALTKTQLSDGWTETVSLEKASLEWLIEIASEGLAIAVA